MSEEMECPDCCGLGTRLFRRQADGSKDYVNVDYSDTWPMGPDQFMENCERCEGSGILEADDDNE